MEVRDQIQAPAALTLEKDPQYPLDRRLGEPENWSGHCTVDKSGAPTGNRVPAVQPIAHLYTDWAVLALQYAYTEITFKPFHVE
jgi:hypothetical protein